jgi:hypothetical protein
VRVMVISWRFCLRGTFVSPLLAVRRLLIVVGPQDFCMMAVRQNSIDR